MSSARERRPRDPAGRRQAIVEAATRVIARRGLGQLTHRLVASEADVPVGSTTYYFGDLGELREAALTHAAATSAAHLEEWRRILDAGTDLPAALAQLTADYLADHDRYRTLNELYLAASYRAELRPLARVWNEGIVALLEPRVGRRAAEAIAVFLDGAMSHPLATGTPLSTEALTDAIARLADNRYDTRAPSRPR
ncbi:TetR/AcrR family transcriptional regulator [Mycobacterium camsae]|uniref:TetR/AcrR family transcriptional regulator n=1 Tax=Mycobacterium gordonae TaxID=1778 RepID=UPI00197CF511|nr:TetR family transcriptional regulator [Mycobacterium gordonae]